MFESGKKAKYDNIIKIPQNLISSEMKTIYENIGKIFDVIERKDLRLEEISIELESSERILQNVVRLLNHDENEEEIVEKNWH